jgi:alpha-beta hydrolase superfamily lysophospholipase
MTPRAFREMTANLGVLQAEKARIGGPLFVAVAGDDRIVSAPAVLAFARALPGDVTIREYPGMYHQILHERDQDRVFGDLESWLSTALTRAAA